MTIRIYLITCLIIIFDKKFLSNVCAFIAAHLFIYFLHSLSLSLTHHSQLTNSDYINNTGGTQNNIKYCHESLSLSLSVFFWVCMFCFCNTIIKLVLIWLSTEYLRAVRREYAAVIIIPYRNYINDLNKSENCMQACLYSIIKGHKHVIHLQFYLSKKSNIQRDSDSRMKEKEKKCKSSWVAVSD